MKSLLSALTMSLLITTPLFAQEKGIGGEDARGYVAGFGGTATTVTTIDTARHTTGDVRFEGGVRIAPHVMIGGNVGRFANLQAELQPSLDATTAAVASIRDTAIHASLPCRR